MLLVKAKAEALEFTVSEKDAEIDLLQQRQERQETQVAMSCTQRKQLFMLVLQLQHAGCLQDMNRHMLTAQQLCCTNIAGVLPVMSSCDFAQSGLNHVCSLFSPFRKMR